MSQSITDKEFVEWFRSASPYINAFRGQTFVVTFGGEIVAEHRFTSLAHDIALLNSLGIRLVLVHGARPQIEAGLRRHGARIRYVNGRRVTDADALACVKEAAGTVRVEIEALLSMGLVNTPMAGARIRVASGNFVTAQPLGIWEGTDYQYTGAVRRIHEQSIRQQLDTGAIVLLSPLGYSPTGEVFNLTALEVGAAAAAALEADKYISLVDAQGLERPDGGLERELTLAAAENSPAPAESGSPITPALRHAVEACRSGVRRAHLIDSRVDGALLLELFTRDGTGTMITTDVYEGIRQATVEDIGGILNLIAPLETAGLLVRRSRQQLEIEVDEFTVVERDGMIIACAALHPLAREGVGELACLAVHPAYRHSGYGAALLRAVEDSAGRQGFSRLFVLTTHASHWFREHGFRPATLDELPVERQQCYNYQRNSKVFVRDVRPGGD